MDMGTSNQGFGATWDLSGLEHIRFFKQAVIDNSKSIDDRRKLGQFSTPYKLAEEIVSFGVNLLSTDKISFFEPCIGSGAFYSALLSIAGNNRIQSATGIEIDREYFECAKDIWSDTGINLLNADFVSTKPDRQYNLLITNPPYVRHHYLSQEAKISLSDAVKKEAGITLSGLAGLYCHFIMLAHKWLAPNAISGWLIPSEFMDVNYGKAVKDYLLNHVHLLKIHRYDPKNVMFSDALVSSCVVWFKNEIIDCDYDVEFTFGGTHEQPQRKKLLKKSDLVKERKWTRFPEKECRKNDNNSNKITLGNFFEIKRGLVTGDNDFFIMSREKISELGLDMSFFKPVLPSPRYLKTDCVHSDSKGMPQLDPQYFLLDCELPESEIEQNHPAIWRYLQSGIEKTSGKYLCRSRKKWYWQEQRPVTYFLCSYMGRCKSGGSPVRFILNLSNAIVTNSYFMLYPKEQLKKAIANNQNVVFKIWEILKNINTDNIEEEGRIYGGGLRKIEPNELSKVPCGDLISLS